MDEARNKNDAPPEPAPEKPAEAEEFPIKDFPDLRRLRAAYLRHDDHPVELDSNDNPRPGTREEDFGLRRSSEEEAWRFLCDSLAEAEEAADDLTEFLDDD